MNYAWSYVLNSGISLMEDEHGGLLISKNPLAVFRINHTAFQLLKYCESSLRLEDDSSLRFLESFREKGVLRRVYQTTASDKEYPFVTVVIPVRNRPQEIKSCLESVFACDYPPHRMEIIVVDDFSTDGETKEVIRQYPVTLIEMTHHVGQSKCRNIGANLALGDVLAFTDSDCVVKQNWLSVLIAPFANIDVGIVGGGVDSYECENVLDVYEQVRSPLHMGNSSAEIAPNSLVPYVPTCNALVRKEAFLQVNGFSEEMRFGEDVDLIWRVLQKGYKGWYLPEGKISHRHRNHWRSFLKRRAEYASSEATLERKFSFNRKKMYLSHWNGINMVIFLLFLIGMGVFKNSSLDIVMFLALVALVSSFASELWVKKAKLQKIDVVVSHRYLIKAVGRSHLGFLGQFTGLFSRYYSIPVLVAALIIPAYVSVVLIAFLASAYFEFMVKRPKMNYFLFAIVYILEMLSYQCGVFYGCLREGIYTPLVHKIKII